MIKLPSMRETHESLTVRQEAVDTVSALIERNLELEEIHNNLQPLLHALSVALYADNDETITLNKLIEDGVKYIKGERQ